MPTFNVPLALRVKGRPKDVVDAQHVVHRGHYASDERRPAVTPQDSRESSYIKEHLFNEEPGPRFIRIGWARMNPHVPCEWTLGMQQIAVIAVRRLNWP